MTREDLRRRGAELRSRLHPQSVAPSAVPGYGDWMDEVAYGGIWARPGLAMTDRMICTLATLSVLQRLDALGGMVGAALSLDMRPRAILEVFMQVGLYAGFPTTEASAARAREVFAARGLTVPDEPARDDSNEALDARGREVMAMLHGERGNQGYAAPGNPITGTLYPSAVRYGYGELWSRPGLTHRERMLCAIAAFTAMGLEGQLRKFSQSALNVGLTREKSSRPSSRPRPMAAFRVRSMAWPF